MRTRLLFGFVALSLAATGCVKKGVHEDALMELAQERANGAELAGELDACRATVEIRDADLAATQDNLAAVNAELDACNQQLSDARALLDDSSEQNAALAQRLEELASIEAELRARNEIFDAVLERFQALIDAGTLEVAIERGRLVLKLPQDILFGSGSAELGDEGVEAISEVGGVLATLSDREFQVEGHTDNVPISSARFPSNWELSSARAIAVVKVFIESGVAPENVSAAGFGEFRPRASNDEAEGRALNRRIEIVMVPDLEMIFGETTTP